MFAIAITLLVLEISAPHLEGASDGATLAGALLELWPSYFGYLTSFLIIGIMWAQHHAMFSLIRRSSHAHIVLNTLLLLCIAFIPLPTAVLAEYLPDPHEQGTAAQFYSGAFVVTAVVFNVLWRYATRKRRLVAADASEHTLNTITRRYLLGPPLYGTAFLLAFVSVWASLAMNAALALLYLLPITSDN